MFKKKEKKERSFQSNLTALKVGLGILAFAGIGAAIGFSVQGCKGDSSSSSEDPRIVSIYNNLISSLSKKYTELNISKIVAFSYSSPNVYIQTIEHEKNGKTPTNIFTIEYSEGLNSFLSQFGNGVRDIESPISFITENVTTDYQIQREEPFTSKYGFHTFLGATNYVPENNTSNEVHFTGFYKVSDTYFTLCNIAYSLDTKSILDEPGNGVNESDFTATKENYLICSLYDHILAL